MMNTEEREQFLAERRTGAGGSDIVHLFNLPPYGCERRLWLDKRGVTPDKPQETGGVLKRGILLEPIVGEEYTSRTDRVIERVETARHPEIPEWMCHRDFVTWGCAKTPAPAEGPGPLSIKTAGRQVFYEMKRTGLSAGYILQLQSEMAITGALWGSFAILWPDGWQTIWFDQKADPELQGRIREAVLTFWPKVENGPAPERLEPDSPQCHHCPYSNQCQGEAMAQLAARQGVGTVRDSSLSPLVQEFLEAKSIFNEAEEYLDGVKEQIRASMGDRGIVEVPGYGKIHYTVNREWDTRRLEAERPEIARRFMTKWDLTALGKAHPELEPNYKKPGQTRPLRIFAK